MTWKTDGKWYGHKVHEYQSDDGIRMRVTRHWSMGIEFVMMSVPWDTRAEKFARDLEVNIKSLEILHKELEGADDKAGILTGRIKWLEDKLGNRGPSPITQETRYSSGQVGMLDPAVAEQEG